MNKLDVIVAVAGGVILVIAIVGATLSGSATSAYDVRSELSSATTPDKPLTLAATGTARATQTIPIPDTNVAVVHVRVTITATPAFPSGGTMHVKITAPDGNVTEKDSGTAVAGGATMTADVSVNVADPPTNRTVTAPSADAAVRESWSHNSTVGTGNWTIEVSYAPGPVPAPQVAGQLHVDWMRWNAVATPAAPVSR